MERTLLCNYHDSDDADAHGDANAHDDADAHDGAGVVLMLVLCCLSCVTGSCEDFTVLLKVDMHSLLSLSLSLSLLSPSLPFLSLSPSLFFPLSLPSPSLFFSFAFAVSTLC